MNPFPEVSEFENQVEKNRYPTISIITQALNDALDTYRNENSLKVSLENKYDYNKAIKYLPGKIKQKSENGVIFWKWTVNFHDYVIPENIDKEDGGKNLCSLLSTLIYNHNLIINYQINNILTLMNESHYTTIYTDYEPHPHVKQLLKERHFNVQIICKVNRKNGKWKISLDEI